MEPLNISWYVKNTDLDPRPTRAMIILPGRGQTGNELADKYDRHFQLGKRGIAVFAINPPAETGWYPSPNSPLDQDLAVIGLNRTITTIKHCLSSLQDVTKIERSNVIFVGFSAGAVVALHFSLTADPPLAGVIVHSGAILELSSIKEPKTNQTPILLNHSLDDRIFTWSQRYEPMRRRLLSQNYKIDRVERTSGGHMVTLDDIEKTRSFLENFLGYDPE